jgi:hypothetical protein
MRVYGDPQVPSESAAVAGAILHGLGPRPTGSALCAALIRSGQLEQAVEDAPGRQTLDTVFRERVRQVTDRLAEAWTAEYLGTGWCSMKARESPVHPCHRWPLRSTTWAFPRSASRFSRATPGSPAQVRRNRCGRGGILCRDWWFRRPAGRRR